MKIPIPLFKKKPKPAPEVRRALDVDTGLPIPMAVMSVKIDWKWRVLNALSAVVKYASIAAYVFAHIPGKWCALAFAVASASKDVAFIIADYLDNGRKDNSFNAEGQA